MVNMTGKLTKKDKISMCTGIPGTILFCVSIVLCSISILPVLVYVSVPEEYECIIDSVEERVYGGSSGGYLISVIFNVTEIELYFEEKNIFCSDNEKVCLNERDELAEEYEGEVIECYYYPDKRIGEKWEFSETIEYFGERTVDIYITLLVISVIMFFISIIFCIISCKYGNIC